MMNPAKGIHQIKCSETKCVNGESRIAYASCLGCIYAVMEILDTNKETVLHTIVIGKLNEEKKVKTEKKNKELKADK